MDAYEKSKHHTMYISSVLPIDTQGRLSSKAFLELQSKEQESNAIRRSVALSPGLAKATRQLKGKVNTVVTNTKRGPLKGPYEHFVKHSGAIIPFRNNPTRATSLNDSSTGVDPRSVPSLAEELLAAGAKS